MGEAQPFALQAPGRHFIMVGLGGQRLLGLGTSAGWLSEDGGRTWSEPFEFKYRGEALRGGEEEAWMGDLGQLEAPPGYIATACRLSTGEVGGIMREQLPDLSGQYPHETWDRLYFITSRDEGRSWSARSVIGHPVEHLELINGMIQLRSGRILAPVNWFTDDYEHEEYRGEGKGHSFRGGYGTFQGRRMLIEGHGHTPEFGGVVVYYSDDLGQTWKSSPNNLWIWPLPAEGNVGGHSALYEPVAVETEDNCVLMLCRTLMGRLYQCISEDGGVHWSVPQPTELASSDSPCQVARIPSTGDLVIIWNQLSSDEITRGLKRSRICVAISTDQGATWTNFKTLEVAAGLPAVGRIAPPPLRHYHSLDNMGVVPETFGCFDYPNIAVVEDMVLFSYNVQWVRPTSEWTEETPIYGERTYFGQIRAFPVSWFYE